MRVNDCNVTGPEITKSGQSPQHKDVTRSDSSQRGYYDGSGEVEISSLAASLSGALVASDTQRNGRIQQLSEQMDSGRYTIDPHAVSAAMVSETLASRSLADHG